jgi:hypothetical protein
MNKSNDNPRHAELRAPEQQATPYRPPLSGDRPDPLVQADQRVPMPVDAWKSSEIALELIDYLKGADAKRH